MSLPERDLAQRMAALDRANEIRFNRSALKADLREGRTAPCEAMVSDLDWMQGMRIRDILLATPALGKVKVDAALRLCNISPSKTVGGITERQRRTLATYLQEHYPCAEIGAFA